ncbi:OmpA/MotB family protein [Lutibaculum baratangense]|uniref:Flagellar motor rotation protein MotB n=1 Tax=Lutibaculum baratangense AMV1 TaxID=631454 RepID=V4TD74_9HYPH|nr:flagellar motor protein MotB [Lutibaculum baratangense]ESR24243.1 Flagellar motor rotation protein MotB [Lutibaculum baratangense AMV1]
MARKQKLGRDGPPEWIVTFADLMSLLSCFFVLIISFSIQDEQKLQIVAGSMREAFGVNREEKRAGVIELDGLPQREFLKRQSPVPMDRDSSFATEQRDTYTQQGPEANTTSNDPADIESSRQFATASASLRQAWREMPDILELSDQIIYQETEDGLDIQIVDEEGRSMFPPGSRYPYERARLILSEMAPIIARMPNRIVITGHTSAESENEVGHSAWDLSAERANAVRGILSEHGVPQDQFAAVTGKADAEPLFPENPFMAANRRISILLKKEDPPLPPDLRP